MKRPSETVISRNDWKC